MPARSVSGWPPRWLTPVKPAEVKRGDGQLVEEFVEAYCVVTMDSVGGKAGDRILLRDWQRLTLRHLFARRADGRRKHRVGLIGVGRKNTKSTLGSAIGLFGLLTEGKGAQVYSCAADRDQARIVFGVAKRMVELDPELSEQCRLYRDVIEVPSTGSIYRALSSEAFTKEGLNASVVVFDEVHAQPNDELFNVMTLGSAARIDPLVVGLTTAGVATDSRGQPTLCRRLYLHGIAVAEGRVDDPSYFMAWWEPKDPDADHRLEKTWREANPGYGDLIDPEDFESAVRRTPEAEFRTKRCNQWVTSMRTWLPHGAWDACASARRLQDGEECILGFDGSYAGDSTALVACTFDGHLEIVGVWEKPADDEDWRVDIEDVEKAITAACRRYQVREVACDPYRWARSMQVLAADGIPIIEWPTNSAQRMVPATTRFGEAVLGKRLTHTGDTDLGRHIGNCVLKIDRIGPRIVKEHKMSARKIDLAVAAVIAYDRAMVQEEEPVPTIW